MMSSLSLVFIWLDKRIGNLPGGNEKIKDKFRKILTPIRQFDRPTSCLDCLEQSLKGQQVFFLTSNIFADDLFLKKIASLSNVCRIYVTISKEAIIKLMMSILPKKMGAERIIQFDERLYEQIILDLVDIYSKESDRLKKGKEAKQLLESAVKLLGTIDYKDEDLQQMEVSFISRIEHLE